MGSGVRASSVTTRQMVPSKIVIGTRGSRLALAQTEAVAQALRQAHPALDVQVRVISTEGDRVTDAPLPNWGQGVFVRDIERALLDSTIDLAVHSLKDVPAELPAGLAIVAIPAREDPSDVLVTRDGRTLDQLASGARVGTSSLRRAAFLRTARPDLEYASVRGNVDTRWRKLLDPEQGYDALVLAAAGLARLGMADVPRWPIPFDVLLPAPGQGALALEARAGDAAVHELAAAVHDAAAAAVVLAERRALRDLEGGCRLPVAALGTVHGYQLRLRVAVATPDGSRVLRGAAEGHNADPEAVGARAAQALLDQGAANLLQGAVLAGGAR